MNENQLNQNKQQTVVRKRVYRWYLILSAIYSSLIILFVILEIVGAVKSNLAGFVFVFGVIPSKYGAILSPIALAWALFSVIMFIVMLVKRIEKRALWLPSLYVFNLILGYLMLNEKAIQIGQSFIYSIMPSVIVTIISIITLVLAIKMLRHK